MFLQIEMEEDQKICQQVSACVLKNNTLITWHVLLNFCHTDIISEKISVDNSTTPSLVQLVIPKDAYQNFILYAGMLVAMVLISTLSTHKCVQT